MSVLTPTPKEQLVDRHNRPYFLWDCDLDLDEFQARLEHGTAEERAYLAGKLMRQAKPDDVFTFLSLQEVLDLWPTLERYLGHTRSFWHWILSQWEPGALD